jgi:hypothetical protein
MRHSFGRLDASPSEKEIEKEMGRGEYKTNPGGTAQPPIMRVDRVFGFGD